jgi:hypothetical protein
VILIHACRCFSKFSSAAIKKTLVFVGFGDHDAVTGMICSIFDVYANVKV